jgi:uncharacterized membrane protein YhaH (DUF805 family)
MGVYIGKSTKIVDRMTGEVMYGEVPPYSVVVAGSMPRLSRKTYALAMLFWTRGAVDPGIGGGQGRPRQRGAMAMAGFGFIWSFLLAAWSIAVTSIKRLHDAGLPGIWSACW